MGDLSVWETKTSGTRCKVDKLLTSHGLTAIIQFFWATTNIASFGDFSTSYSWSNHFTFTGTFDEILSCHFGAFDVGRHLSRKHACLIW